MRRVLITSVIHNPFECHKTAYNDKVIYRLGSDLKIDQDEIADQ